VKAKPKRPEQDDLFRARLVEIINMRHELVKLAAMIDWEFFERDWAGFFPSVQRNFAWMEEKGLIYEMTGQGRYQVWRAAV
jgi:hypothetical protein